MGRRNYDNIAQSREPSIEIKETWENKYDIEFASLIDRFTPAKAENLVECGALDRYDPRFDRITPKTPPNLKRYDLRHFNVTTSSDPIIRRLHKQKAGNVFGTDTILAVLMASTRSVNSWDLVVTKDANGNIFFDKRQYSRIDFLTVNENWHEVLEKSKDNVNHPRNLSVEATVINHNFTQQVLIKNQRKDFPEPDPFLTSLQNKNKAASVAYRYRRWDLGDGIKLVARCALNAYMKKRKGEEEYLSIRALNEWDSKIAGSVPWRAKLEAQPAAVLATEMKNNANKLARWTAEVELSGATELRLGFVSRVHNKNNSQHVVLMTKRYAPNDWASFIQVKVQHLWGTLTKIIKQFQSAEIVPGMYLLMKDPNHPKLKIYALPSNEFSFPC